MIFEYQCRPCGDRYFVEADEPPSSAPRCPECAVACVRRFSFGFQRSTVKHEADWNYSTGTVVSTTRQFENDLKRLGEERTERTGIPHSYVPVDPTDTKALGATEAHEP